MMGNYPDAFVFRVTALDCHERPLKPAKLKVTPFELIYNGIGMGI